MDTRKIYYVYKNVKREVNELKHRINNNDFLELLLRPSKDDFFFTTLFKPSKISNFIDEWAIKGFTGEYNRDLNGKYYIKGDVMMIKEINCPSNITKEEFMSLSVEELDKLIINKPNYECSTEYVCNNLPVNIDIFEEVEFKPAFDKLRMIVKNNTDNHSFFDFDEYKEKINSFIKESCDKKDLEFISYYRDTIIYNLIKNFSDNIEKDFNFNNKPFIITDEIKNNYRKSILKDFEKAFDDHLQDKKLKKTDVKGGKRR